MRILRVAQKLYPEVPGGGPYHVHAMSRDQAAMGHDVTVLTVTDDDSLPRREQRDGYTVVRRKPTVELLGNEISIGVAQFLRDADDFDVIHAHSHLYFSTNLTALKRRMGETPLAITNHGLYSQNAPERLFDVYLQTIGQWTFNQADVVFCYTDEDRKRVRAFDVDSRIEVIPNGVDTERFTPNGPTSDMIDHDGPVVLFVGRLVEGKRPQDAIKAISGVTQEKNAKLYMIGDGPMREELEAMSGEETIFLGQLAYDEMPAIYRAGDVLVLPSRAEGLPRTVLEAMASGLPVVMSNLEQVAPIVDGNGFLFPIGDTQKISVGIQEILDRDDKNPRKRIVDKFNWDETVLETTTALNEL